MHAFSNDAPVPVQTPIPSKDIIVDGVSKIITLSPLHLMDRFYQILMREQHIMLTAVTTPSKIPWKWLIVPMKPSVAPASFNIFVTSMLRSVRDSAPTYINYVLVQKPHMPGNLKVESYRV